MYNDIEVENALKALKNKAFPIKLVGIKRDEGGTST
jgi:hypothetical protein